MAEGGRFELPDACASPVFKSGENCDAERLGAKTAESIYRFDTFELARFASFRLEFTDKRRTIRRVFFVAPLG